MRSTTYWVAFYAIKGASRLVNRTFYQGALDLTLSARAHLEGRSDPGWARIERRINRLFRDPDHCATCWQHEIRRAERILALERDLNEPWNTR
jgi:hypothetical protein